MVSFRLNTSFIEISALARKRSNTPVTTHMNRNPRFLYQTFLDFKSKNSFLS